MREMLALVVEGVAAAAPTVEQAPSPAVNVLPPSLAVR